MPGLQPWFLTAFFLLWPMLASAEKSYLTDLSEQLTFCINQQFTDYSTPALYAELDLQEVCPLLFEAVEGHNNSRQQSADELSFLSTFSVNTSSTNIAELMDLSYFVANSQYRPTAQYVVNFSELDDILASTLQQQNQQVHISWWQRFINWLSSKKETDKDEVDLRWLEDFVKKFALSEATAKIVLYAGSIFIVLLTLILVFREIYLSRLSAHSFWYWRRKKPSKQSVDYLAPHEQTDIIPDELPVRLPELLNICIDYLIRWQRLPARKSQTNYEFLRYLRLSDDVVARPFSMIFQHAERDIYGGHTPDDAIIECCHDEARAILSAYNNSSQDNATESLPSMRAK